MAYTNSPLVTYTKLSPNRTAPRNHKIDTITIHCMAGNLSVETCGNVFAPTSRRASSNYGIGSDGRIAMYCEEKNRSWCTANKSNDHRAITIEVANDGGAPEWHVSDKAMESLIKLCADICRRNDIKKLVWSNDKNERVKHLNGCNMTIHRDYDNTACPGEYLYSKQGYIAEEVNKLLGFDTEPKTIVTYTSHRIETNKWGKEIVGYNLINNMGYSGSFGKKLDKFTVKLSEGEITYTAHRNGKWGNEIHGYSMTDTNNYAGSSNKPIDAIAIKATGINGKLKYRVHRTDGKWGKWITGYSLTDTNNYAGSFGKPIDAIQIGIE